MVSRVKPLMEKSKCSERLYLVNNNCSNRGFFKLILKDSQNRIIAKRSGFNLITNAGRAELAALGINVDSPTAFDAIAIGTGTTPPVKTDTTLEAEITTGGGERRSGANVTKQRVTTYETDDTLELVTTFSFTAAFTLTEIGVFNDPSAGDLLARRVFTGVPVDNGNTFQATYRVILRDKTEV